MIGRSLLASSTAKTGHHDIAEILLKHNKSNQINLTINKSRRYKFLILYLQVYQVSDERKEDQVSVDKQVLDVIRKSADKKYLFGYLGAMFSLQNRQYPHKMVF